MQQPNAGNIRARSAFYGGAQDFKLRRIIKYNFLQCKLIQRANINAHRITYDVWCIWIQIDVGQKRACLCEGCKECDYCIVVEGGLEVLGAAASWLSEAPHSQLGLLAGMLHRS